jgi:farnesyl-diphosphate farnesyltransferase
VRPANPRRATAADSHLEPDHTEAGDETLLDAAALDRLLEETSRTFALAFPLLEETSRTFALAIPLLEEPTRRQVTLAYLLFRIADTFEDAETWPRARRLGALAEFADLLDRPETAAVRAAADGWLSEPPCEHPGYLRLLAAAPGVFAAFQALDDRAREAIRVHTRRTAEGMASFVDRGSPGGRLELSSLDDLVAYCYVVAGIVGEMLTELFLLAGPSVAPAADFLRRRAARFGEALQLVNILKDSAGDAVQGRRYLPADVDRGQVFDLARRDLETAAAYVRTLQRNDAPRGVVAFTALPVLLARATLDQVERRGPGAKLSRPAVYALAAKLKAALAAGRPAV